VVKVRFVVRDDLRRSRLTVAFRLILAIPHILWFSAWGSGMALVLPVQWFATLITRRPIAGLAEVFELFVRYSLHVYAYVFLAGSPFPGFFGRRNSYPVDVGPFRVDEEQSRWSVGFRLFLALPPYLLVSALGSGFLTSAGSAFAIGIGPAAIAAFLAWFAILVKGRMPPGHRDLIVYAGAYATQVAAYFFLLTGRYPDSDPHRIPLQARPHHPVRMRDTRDLSRHRLIVFFRLILAVPHFVWLTLWGVVAFVAAFGGWLAGIALGRLPRPLHRFLSRYVRYSSHVYAFATVAARPFPGFTGLPGSYPLDIEIDPPERQSRWSIGFRWLLAFPAFLLVSAFGAVQSVAPVGAWFFALVTGRAPRGLEALLAYTIRYQAQSLAYSLLLTPRYPHSGPSEGYPPLDLKPFELAPELPIHAPSPQPVDARALVANAGRELL
jgi:hypothetical protein